VSTPHEGTTFFFELSESHLPIDAPTITSMPPLPPRTELPHILHVEDDRQSRELMSTLLADLAVVTEAPSVARAFELLAENRYELVLLDLELGGALGSDVLREIRGQSMASSVLVYTAHEELLDPSIRELADAVLIKTRISERELRIRIEDLLRHSGRFESAVPLHVS